MSKQFPDNVLASFYGISKPNTVVGPFPADKALQDLADKHLVDTKVLAAATNVSHAVPHPIANITSFAAGVRRVNEELRDVLAQRKAPQGYFADLQTGNPVVYAQYMEWLGLCAIVALRHVCGIRAELHYEPFNAAEPMDKAVWMALHDSNEYYNWQATAAQGGGISGGLFYLVVNGSCVAIYNAEVGLAPMQKYSAAEFCREIPWFDSTAAASVHACWKNPFEIFDGDAYRLSRLAQWLHANGYHAIADVYGYPAPTDGNCIACVNNPTWNAVQMQSMMNGAVPPVHSATKAQYFCDACCAYLDARGVPCALPQLLEGEMLLAYCPAGYQHDIGYQNDNGQWQPLRLVCGAGCAVDTTEMIPILPLTVPASEKLGVEYDLQQAVVTARAGTTPALDYLELDIRICFKFGAKDVYSVKRRYPLAHVRYGILPILAVWPSVGMPVDMGWRYYLATQTSSGINAEVAVWNGIPLANTRLKVHGGTDYNVGTQNTTNAWKVTQSSAPFRFAELQYVIRDKASNTVTEYPCGTVWIRPNPVLKAPTISSTVATDFGTTSTVMAKTVAGVSSVVPILNLTRVVTVSNGADGIKEIVQNRLQGAVPTQLNAAQVLLQRKVMTVAQIFDCNPPPANGMAPYLGGRCSMASAVSLFDVAQGHDFASHGIYSDLKLATLTNPAVLVSSQIYLAGLYLHAMFDALQHGERIDHLHLSYPNRQFEPELKARWQGAAAIVNSCMDAASPYRLQLQFTAGVPGKGITAVHFCTEAEAAKNFCAGKGTYMIVDIGGGTTDISIIGGSKTASFKYAGREMMIDSLTELYRKWNPDGAAPAAISQARENSFKNLWGKGNEKDKKLAVDAFLNRTGTFQVSTAAREKAVGDESLRMMSEGLMNDFDLTIPNNRMYDLLREQISIKFGLIITMVAEFVAENKGFLMDKIPATPGMTYDGVPKSRPTLVLQFVGTAAKALCHVFNKPLTDINGLNSDTDNLTFEIEKIINTIAQTDFRIELQVSANVADKQEVAFGMLSMANMDAAAGGAPIAAANDNAIVDACVAMLWEQLEPLDAIGRVKLFNTVLGAPPRNVPNNTQQEYDAESRNVMSVLPTAQKDALYQRLLNTKRTQKIQEQANAMQSQKGLPGASVEIGKMLQSTGNIIVPVAAAIGGAVEDANNGLGVGVSSILNDVLPAPHTAEFQTLVSASVTAVLADEKSMRSLTAQEEDSLRARLFRVYVANTVLNKAISQKQ